MPTGHYHRRKYKSYKDPKAVLTATEKAYLAGIIDGEGSIMAIHHPQRKDCRYEYWTPRVLVANTNKALIQWLLKRFGGGISFAKSKHRAHKDTYHWRIDSKRAVPIILNALPYLLLKKNQAILALALVKTKQKHYGCKGAPKHVVEWRRALANTMKKLNRRGKC